MSTISLNFGALGGTLKSQLKKQNLVLKPDFIKERENERHCLTVCFFSNLIDEKTYKKGLDKVFSKILKEANKQS